MTWPAGIAMAVILIFHSTNIFAGTLFHNNSALQLQDKARACYMTFFKLYDAELYANDELTQHCIKLTYLRDIEVDQLSEATIKIYQNLYGENLDDSTRTILDEIGAAYRDVSEGDSYQYCVSKNIGGELARDNQIVIAFKDQEIARRIMTIWRRQYDDEEAEWNFTEC